MKRASKNDNQKALEERMKGRQRLIEFWGIPDEETPESLDYLAVLAQNKVL